MKKGILLLLIPLMFSCKIEPRTYKVHFMASGGTNIVTELDQECKAGEKIADPYTNLQVAKGLLPDGRIAVKWEIMTKNDDGTFSASNLFFNPEVDTVGCELFLRATEEGDDVFTWKINFRGKNGNKMFTKSVPAGEKIVFTDAEKEKIRTSSGYDIFFGEDWKVTNSTDVEKTDFYDALNTTITRDTFAVNSLEVNLQPGEWDVQENFKCFADCTWNEIVNAIHGKTLDGKDTPWVNADFPTGYARLLFDNVNLPQLEASNREGGTNMAGQPNVKTPHNCFSSGCQKLVHISATADADDYFVHMIGFDHDVMTDTISGNTAKKAPLTLQMVGALKTAHRFSSVDSCVDHGWYTSNNELRKVLNNTSNNYIPTATDGSTSFKVVKCKKGSAKKEAGTDNVASCSTSDDYLWVPDIYEVFGMAGALGKTSSIGGFFCYWYDSTRELNLNASHSFIGTSPTDKYFLRVSGNDNAHAPWYSVAWDKGTKKYVANPRGVFKGDRADFTGFKGTVADDGVNWNLGTEDSTFILHCPTFSITSKGASQYEYWARFHTETPYGVNDKTPRYKGSRDSGNDAGLYTYKKPSIYKCVHFKKNGGTEEVSGTERSTTYLSRTPQINEGCNINFELLGNYITRGFVGDCVKKFATSLMFAIE